MKLFFNINPKGFKTRVSGKLWSIDIYIEELNLAIEFDGSYWHKGKRELDKLKTKKLSDTGLTIMRIREEPLKPITEIDIVSNLPFNPKEISNKIFKFILNSYSLTNEKIEDINSYLKKSSIQNEHKLDKYVDDILMEKSNKKRSTTKPKLH